MSGEAGAMEPEDVTRLVVERLNAGDAAGVAALYEPQGVLAYPADRPMTGREAIRAVYQRMVDAGVRFGSETPLPTVRFELGTTENETAGIPHTRASGPTAPLLRSPPSGMCGVRMRSELRSGPHLHSPDAGTGGSEWRLASRGMAGKTWPIYGLLRRMVRTERKLHGRPPLGLWPRSVSPFAIAREPSCLLA
jgi:hypothetical protein